MNIKMKGGLNIPWIMLYKLYDFVQIVNPRCLTPEDKVQLLAKGFEILFLSVSE